MDSPPNEAGPAVLLAHAEYAFGQLQRWVRAAAAVPGASVVVAPVDVTALDDGQVQLLRQRARAAGVDVVLADRRVPPRPGTVREGEPGRAG